MGLVMVVVLTVFVSEMARRNLRSRPRGGSQRVPLV